MSAVSDLATEIAEALAVAGAGSTSEVTVALMDERVEIGAVGPSGRVWVTDGAGDAGQPPIPSIAVLALVEAGFGLVARLDRGAWITVRPQRASEGVAA